MPSALVTAPTTVCVVCIHRETLEYYSNYNQVSLLPFTPRISTLPSVFLTLSRLGMFYPIKCTAVTKLTLL